MAPGRQSRLLKELDMMAKNPVSGISIHHASDVVNVINCQIIGPPDTPYEDGIFDIVLSIPERYPFEPPGARFLTKIYHPNIDDNGRICLDLLHCPPRGSWKPIHNIQTLLTSIRLLMSTPNPDDSLMSSVGNQYKLDRAIFEEEARRMTKLHAIK